MASDTVVVPRRKDPDLDALIVGAPGRAPSHLDIARLLHWVRGRGRTLVPYHVVNRAAAGSAVTLRYQTQPSGVAIERIWIVTIRGGTAGGLPVAFYDISLEAGAGGVVTYPCRFAPTVLYYRETGCTKTTSLTEVSIEVTPIGGKTIIVEGVACYELPRALLTPGAPDYGVHLDSFYPRRAIYAHDTEGLDALVQSLAQTDGRRIGLVSWFGSDCSTTSGAFVDAFETPIPITPRRDRSGTVTVEWAVLARASNGTTAGEFYVEASNPASNDTQPLVLTTTTDTWIAGRLDVDAEDLASAEGDVGETVKLQARRTAGAGSVVWSGFEVWEAPP